MSPVYLGVSLNSGEMKLVRGDDFLAPAQIKQMRRPRVHLVEVWKADETLNADDGP